MYPARAGNNKYTTYLRPLHDAIPLDKRGRLRRIHLSGPFEEFLLRSVIFLIDAHIELDKGLLVGHDGQKTGDWKDDDTGRVKVDDLFD